MPRKSVEAQIMEKWLPSPEHPKPRPGMSEAAQRLWSEIVGRRPADWFRPGAQSLLRTYCEVSTALEKLGPRISEGDVEAIKQAAKLTPMQVSLATKLRLTVIATLRLDKAEVAERRGRGGGFHPLLVGKTGAFKPPWEPADDDEEDD
jgi:hypothetical protein